MRRAIRDLELTQKQMMNKSDQRNTCHPPIMIIAANVNARIAAFLWPQSPCAALIRHRKTHGSRK
jgi:hypothetical protein